MRLSNNFMVNEDGLFIRFWFLQNVMISQLDVQAFDHWSTDTKQDAWFTASSFDTVLRH
jgi:hypothetical protein